MLANGYNMTDRQLWELIVKDDKSAFEMLYRRYYSPLLVYALRLGFDEDTAKDCIQDVFVKIYIRRTSYPELTYIKSYLYRALTNALLDKVKSVRSNTSSEDELLGISIEDDGLMELFEKSDADVLQAICLKKAYNQLSNKQKRVIYFHYIQEFSWDEMATVFDMSPHSCMNLLARAITKLRMLIEEYS